MPSNWTKGDPEKEKAWKKAKKIFKDQTDKSESDWGDSEWAQVMAIAKKVLKGNKESIIKEKSKTATCPDCGNKYLVSTGYCLTCKKKVKKEDDTKKENIVEIKEEFEIPGTDIILEKGDKIKVL